MSILSNLTPRKHSTLALLSLRTLRALPKLEFQDAVRFLCETAVMNDDMALCRVLGRYKLFIDRADLGFSSHMIMDGFWQVWATRAIIKAVGDGMSVVDAGANVGYYTLLLADLVGNSGNVHAIELNSRPMNFLRQSVAINGYAGRVHLHGTPSPARAGTQSIRSPGGVSGRKAPFVRTGAVKAMPAVIRSTDQRTICLDDIVKDDRLDFVKISDNGAGRDIWHGMERILARQQPLTIMLDFTSGHHRDPDAFLASMTAATFNLARLDASGSIVQVSAQEILSLPSDQNQVLWLSR